MIRNEVVKAAFFESLVQAKRQQICKDLAGKYKINYDDVEDIYQDVIFHMWTHQFATNKWREGKMDGLLWTICDRMTYKWVKRHKRFEEYDESHDSAEPVVETQNGFLSISLLKLMHKEELYAMLDRLDPRDRKLMEMVVANIRMDQVAKEIGFKNAQVARNRKHKIVVKLCKDINAQADKACAYFFLLFF